MNHGAAGYVAAKHVVALMRYYATTLAQRNIRSMQVRLPEVGFIRLPTLPTRWFTTAAQQKCWRNCAVS